MKGRDGRGRGETEGEETGGEGTGGEGNEGEGNEGEGVKLKGKGMKGKRLEGEIGGKRRRESYGRLHIRGKCLRTVAASSSRQLPFLPILPAVSPSIVVPSCAHPLTLHCFVASMHNGSTSRGRVSPLRT